MILDTNAVSALFLGDQKLGVVLGAADRHHLPTVVIGEYRYGLLRSSQRSRLEELLAALIQQSVVLPVDQKTAEAYSQVRHELRVKGRPIPENDIWIAALARQHLQPIVTRDEHFDQVSNLRRVAW